MERSPPEANLTGPMQPHRQDRKQSPTERRILRVLDHIHRYPAADLSLDALAEVAALSRFHFHRVFRGATGETVAEAVRRIRLHRAATGLIQTDAPIAEIGARAGYPTSSSFTRAFADRYGLPPGAFRSRGVPPQLIHPRPGDLPMYPVTIDTLPAARIAAMPHTGPYAEIGASFDKLSGLLGARKLWPRTRAMVGVFYDDPHQMPADRLRSHAGVLVEDDFPLDAPLEDVRLPAGRAAILTYTGHYAGLQAAYDWLYSGWLHGSGETPADSPVSELYRNTPMDTAPEDLITEIRLPLE